MIYKTIDYLKPKAHDAAEKMLAMLDGTGFKYRILETFRSTEVQAAYFAQGRKSLEVVNIMRQQAGLLPIGLADNKNKITNCDGVKILSAHQGGNAIDIVPIVNGRIPWVDTGISESEASRAWQQLGSIGKSAGFGWGGDWGKTASKLGWDCPHFEIKG